MHMDLTIAIYVICVLVFLGAVCAIGTVMHPDEVEGD